MKHIEKARFNDEYEKKMRAEKFLLDRLKMFNRVYLPFIEEQIYGRESLDIGYGFPERLKTMRKRGWLAEGIDLLHEKEDFETAEFKAGMKWDLIILSHVIQSFNDPLNAIRKAISLLSPGGILFVAAPDPGVILTTGYRDFLHWGESCRTIISKERLLLECAKAGMEKDPLVNVTNFSKRWLHFNDYHLILRKEITGGIPAISIDPKLKNRTSTQ